MRNSKQYRSTEIRNSKRFDLEERTLEFAKRVRDYIKTLPKHTSNYEFSKQLIRSASSIGANYIEANEALGKKDFMMHIKISKKETKETIYWLNLTEPNSSEDQFMNNLIKEATELMNILGAILRNSQ